MTDCKRGQIIEAAVAEFRDKGFAGAAMDRIAARACVSKRTVYNHFASKEALFRAILDRMAAEANEAFAIRYRPGRPIREQLVALGWAEGRLLTSPDFMRLARMVMAETLRDPVLAAGMNEKLARVAAFRAFMEAAAADGALAIDDPGRATAEFLGLIKGQGFWPAIHSGEPVGEAAMEAIVETAVTMFLARYAPPP